MELVRISWPNDMHMSVNYKYTFVVVVFDQCPLWNHYSGIIYHTIWRVLYIVSVHCIGCISMTFKVHGIYNVG
jgi:hypothetical protein